jgi:hypothetical protein
MFSVFDNVYKNQFTKETNIRAFYSTSSRKIPQILQLFWCRIMSFQEELNSNVGDKAWSSVNMLLNMFVNNLVLNVLE